MIADLHRRVAAGERKATIARDMGISRETLYQYACNRSGVCSQTERFSARII
jgi:DNA-binding phage protein